MNRPGSGSTATVAGWRLRGEELHPGACVPNEAYAGNQLAVFHAHVTRALAAAIFGDLAGLARHTAAAMPVAQVTLGHYPSAVARVLRGLALAGQARSSDGATAPACWPSLTR